jgi:RNA-directed DNA polymerase
MEKGTKQSKLPMNLRKEGESNKSDDLFMEVEPVWFKSHGEVNSEWLSICEEERHQTQNLLERIASLTNLQAAYMEVKTNRGSSGIDGVDIKGFGLWFKEGKLELQRALLTSQYEPQAVKQVKIPKPTGGERLLGIPTVKDRVVQQAINRQLQGYYEPKFTTSSYGFRPGRNCHQALEAACRYVKGGKTKVVDIDLAKFFDEVNHQRLLWLLGTRIGDNRLLNLLKKTLKSGILIDGLISQRVKGTPQGSPLSPLLSNIVLDELDQELRRRNLSFVRYADDVKIFVKHKASAERIMVSITKFIEKRMKLKVNEEKSAIRPANQTTFLGYRLEYGGKLGLSQTSESRLKAKLKAITSRKRGISLEQMLREVKSVLQGWLHYFRLARMKKKLEQIEGWLRRRLKCFRLKQCKRVIGIARFLIKLGVEKTLSWRTALSGKGWWRLSNSPAVAMGMNNLWLVKQGFYSLTANYQKLFRNPL